MKKKYLFVSIGTVLVVSVGFVLSENTGTQPTACKVLEFSPDGKKIIWMTGPFPQV